MSSKIFNHIKKVIVAMAIVVICSPHAAYAFSFGSSSNDGTSFIQSLINKLFKIEQKEEVEYITPEEALEKLQALKNVENVELDDIYAILNQMESGSAKNQLIGTVDTFAVTASSESSGFSIGSLLNILIGLLSSLVDGLVGLIGGDALPVEATDITITATTAGKFADGYGVTLNANVYKNEKASNKWALLIHPFMMSGETMANAVGPYYYEAGYNILAIDLRGFGDSEGSVALGFLESLDAYDWLVEMNTNKAVFGDIDHIIVHGTSLGAATTNFLSGIDKFMANGPQAMDLKSLPELKVVGLVEDCGYKNMEQFAKKDFIMSLGIGLTEDNFDYYSNALNSLKHCELPMLIIHGDADTMVDYEENAPVIAETVKDSTLVTIDGGAHALIIMGSNDTYADAVNKFIDKCATADRNEVTNDIPVDNNTADEAVQEESSFLTNLINKLFNFGK